MTPIKFEKQEDAREEVIAMPSLGYGDTECPCLRMEGGEELAELPSEGTLTVKVKRVSKEERDAKGEKKISVTYKILSVEDASETESESEDEETEEDSDKALDRLMKSESEAGDEESEDEVE